MGPNCEDFLEFCLQKFDVAMWSSRTRENLESVVDMFPNLRARLIFCWSQEDCEVISRKGDPGKPTFIKRLEKAWEVHKQYNETNTLLVDDSPCKAICNPASTGIFPPSYDCRITNDNSVGPEGDIRMYLDHLVEAENVKEYVKMNPFWSTPHYRVTCGLELLSRSFKAVS